MRCMEHFYLEYYHSDHSHLLYALCFCVLYQPNQSILLWWPLDKKRVFVRWSLGLIYLYYFTFSLNFRVLDRSFFVALHFSLLWVSLKNASLLELWFQMWDFLVWHLVKLLLFFVWSGVRFFICLWKLGYSFLPGNHLSSLLFLSGIFISVFILVSLLIILYFKILIFA